MKLAIIFISFFIISCSSNVAIPEPEKVYPIVSADTKKQCKQIDGSLAPSADNRSLEVAYKFIFYLTDLYDECSVYNEKKAEFIEKSAFYN